MATSPLFGWEEPDDTDLVKDGAAAIRTLGNAIDTSMGDLLGGTSGQILSKNSNSNMDFTWITNDIGDITAVTASSPLTGGGTSGAITVGIQDGTTAEKGAVQLENSTSSTSTTTAAVPASVKSAYDLANAAIPKSILDAAGDVIYATANDTAARLGIGTTGQVLTVASGVPAWATPASGGGWTLISTSTPSGASAVDFSSISSDYSQLIVTWAGIYASANNSNFLIRLNSDSSTAYKQRELEASGASTMSVYLGVTDNIPCMVRTTSSTETESAAGYMIIFNANSTTLNKYIETVTSYKRADTSSNVIRRSSFHYDSNSAISSVNFFRGETGGTINVTSGGFIQLWGLK